MSAVGASRSGVRPRLKLRLLLRSSGSVRAARVASSLASRVEPSSGEAPASARKLGRGRAAMNAPLKLGGAVQAMEERKASLMNAAEFRLTSKVTAVAPAGTGKLDGVPDRMDFEVGTAAGAAEFAEKMLSFVEENFEHAGIEARSADEHVKKAGFYGYWHERRGHGKCVEWWQVENGWELHALKNEAGDPVVPSFAAVMEFALLVSEGGLGSEVG